MRQRRCRGFTLSELGVGVLLAGMLCGLALPAVQQRREAARRDRCANNLRRIGIAGQEFTRRRNSVLPHNQQVAPFTSWNTQLLPHLNEDEIFKQYDLAHDWWDDADSTNRAAGQNRVAAFLCPAAPHGDRWVYLKDPDDATFRAAPTDYVAVAGAYLHGNDQENLHRGAMACAGRYYGGSGVTGKAAVRLSEIKDGTSHTMMIAEMADKPNSWRAGKLHESKGGPDSPKSLVPSFSFGQWAAPNWNHFRAYDFNGERQFGPCAVNCNNGASIYGFHPGGANVLFVDGSVKFVKARLAEEVMVSMASIAGGEVIGTADYLAAEEGFGIEDRKE